MKRILCLVLCLSLLLSLAGCGKPSAESAAATTAPAETVDPVEAALTVARGLMDAGELDAAEAVLAQAGEDARVAELLAEIDGLRAIDLNVTTDLIYHTGDPETLVVHGMTAQEFSDGMVRFTFDYTAPEGTPLSVLGSYLEYLRHAPATGKREQFVFEISAADIRRIGSKFCIEFGPDSVSMLTVEVQVAWPGEGIGSASDLPMLSDGQPVGEAVELTFEAPEGVTVKSFTRQWLDNQCYRYTLDMSAPQGLTVSVTNADGLVYHDPVSVDGPIVFDLPWSVASVYPEILVNFPDAPEYSFTAYNGYLVTGETPVSEGRPLDYSETTDYDNTYGRMEILSATAWDLTHDYVRYEVVFSSQEVVHADAFYYEPVAEEAIPRFAMKTAADFPSGQQTLTFDLRKEDATGAGHPAVLFTNQDKLFFLIPLFDPLAMNLTDGQPVGDEIELVVTNGNSFRPKKDVQIYGMNAQMLDNGQMRFNMSYTAPKGIAINCYCTYLGGVESHFGIGKGQENETFTFDVSVEHLQDELGMVIMFYDEHMALFALPGVEKMKLPPKIIEPVNLAVIDDPDRPRNQIGAEELPFENGIADLAQTLELKAGELIPQTSIDRETAMSVDTSVIAPLEVFRKMAAIKGQDGVVPYHDLYNNLVHLPSGIDLTGNLPLAYALNFSDTAYFPDEMPAGFDHKALMEWGKEPGLNVDVLHRLGYTGKGAVIAYLDQPLPDEHAAYENVDLHYTSNTDVNSALHGIDTSMHGPAVLSLLAGHELGTAPDATVYYIGSQYNDFLNPNEIMARDLRQLVEQNKDIPSEEKITMVGISNNPRPEMDAYQDLMDAVEECTEAGIMVWFCGEYSAAAWYPLSDRDNFENVIPDALYGIMPPNLVYAPGGTRTVATGQYGKYNYDSSGGLSWTMPYVLGLYAIVTEINPNLIQDELRALIVDTAYVKDNMKIVNPVEFVAAALDGVGKNEEAAELRTAAQRNGKYFYAVMNKSAMTREDLAGAEAYLKDISDSTVLVVDASEIKSAQELYTLLQADHIQRGGRVTGVQLFGTPDLVPAFEVGYKVQLPDAVDDAGVLLTDLFYGNFSNRAEDLSQNYNVLDHFANNWPVQLTPDWKVARLPLGSGEFAPFFEKYAAFAKETGLARQEIVNFSSPVLADKQMQDDMGAFLNRAKDEFGILNTPYRLYGNLRGEYPVTTEVIGGFTAENLAQENSQGIVEFLINAQGQKEELIYGYYENGKEIHESLVDRKNINSVLSENPYYLDLWTGKNGEAMQDNLTTAALNGQCVGVFSATHIISNNGVQWDADLNAMAQSNFYYFYLHYLNALDQGASRSDAFFQAQRNYANALIADSANGLRGKGNYQFNIMNLVGYHNFGLIEPSKAAPCVETTLK